MSTTIAPDPRQRLAAGADLPAAQQPVWPDAAAARRGRGDAARRYPPLVFAGECDELRDRLAAVARGEAFLLQGGDCAETFAAATADNIRDRVKTILQMAVVLTYGASVPVVKVGRMAGQYAKPRSQQRRDPRRRHPAGLPRRHGQRLRLHPEVPHARPAAAGRGLPRSAATLNLVRAFTTGGFADLRQVHDWNTRLRRQLRQRRATSGWPARSTGR